MRTLRYGSPHTRARTDCQDVPDKQIADLVLVGMCHNDITPQRRGANMNYKQLCDYQGRDNPRYILEVRDTYTGQTVKQQHTSRAQAMKKGAEFGRFLAQSSSDNRREKTAEPRAIIITVYFMKEGRV